MLGVEKRGVFFLGLNIFYSEEKVWAWHTTRQCVFFFYHEEENSEL